MYIYAKSFSKTVAFVTKQIAIYEIYNTYSIMTSKKADECPRLQILGKSINNIGTSVRTNIRVRTALSRRQSWMPEGRKR